jgi:hypothetical protein
MLKQINNKWKKAESYQNRLSNLYEITVFKS